jgi:bone morphogenetic protein receptor type-1B
VLCKYFLKSELFLGIFAANGVECYCDGHCPDDKPNGTCVGQPGSQCFSAVEEVYNSETGVWEEERTFGCLPPDESGLMQVWFWVIHMYGMFLRFRA